MALIHQIKIKWWDNYDISRVNKESVISWFQQNPSLWKKGRQSETDQQMSLLRHQLNVSVTEAKTPEEFAALLKQIADQATSTQSASDT